MPRDRLMQLTTQALTRLDFTTPAVNPANLSQAIAEIQAQAASESATIVSQRIFGPAVPVQPQTPWPVTWLTGRKPAEHQTLAIQTVALAGVTPEPIRLAGQTLGFTWETDTARYCHFGNLSSNAAGRPEQALDVLHRMEAALRFVGFHFSDVVRTWFYNDQILDWYPDFNRVRTEFLASRHLSKNFLPASTGIGSANACGKALVADVYAVQSKTGRSCTLEVQSPLQCAAPAYGSSFSRAVEVHAAGRRELYISGTASIAPDGRTVHPGDLAKQIDLTLEVVHAILQSRKMDWSDVTRAIAYFRNDHDRTALPLKIPVITAAPVDVCRADLLFELELDAVAKGNEP